MFRRRGLLLLLLLLLLRGRWRIRARSSRAGFVGGEGRRIMSRLHGHPLRGLVQRGQRMTIRI